MLQVDVKPFASDALEDAMRLAQTKSLNSYTFSDCLNYLNYAWSDIYSRVACIDDGYYGVTVRITAKLTKLPKFVKNSIMIYEAQSPLDHMRIVYRSAGPTEYNASNVYKISGTDLWCPDAERRTVWLYYVPACPQLFFTHHNRDPIIHTPAINQTYDDFIASITKYNFTYNLYKLYSDVIEEESTDITRADILDSKTWYLKHRGTGEVEDITEMLQPEENEDGVWKICFISCDYPYIFITYEHSITGEHLSGIISSDRLFTAYNPFDFTGRNSDVEYLQVHWNDKTGMGVTIRDYNDSDTYKYVDEFNVEHENVGNVVKELGWTPDTQLDYPAPELYRYLVARLADKLSALNESNIMGVQKELIEAKFAFEAFLNKDKSAWQRIENVNPSGIADWL